nr:MAG TPA: hypothetical protein [Bacteriophage sp.]
MFRALFVCRLHFIKSSLMAPVRLVRGAEKIVHLGR